MNNKGFTLVEALAVIVLLGIVLTIGGFSVANYLSKSKTDALDIFKKNIKSGMINYYNECKYLKTSNICKKRDQMVGEETSVIDGNTLNTTISDLLKYGFIENQEKDEENNLIIKNPVTDENITNCSVSITFDSDDQEFENVTYSGGTECLKLNENN